MKKFLNILKEFKEYFSGDFAYKNYLEQKKVGQFRFGCCF
jgi:hypothetical protein